MKQDSSLPDALARIRVDRRERDAGYTMSHHHCHNHYELVCIERGACRFLVEDRVIDLQEGSFLLIPPNLFHYSHYPFGACLRCGIYFRSSDLSQELTALLPGGEGFFSRVQVFQTPASRRAPIAGLLNALAEEERLTDERSALMLRLRLHELLLQCSRVCSFPADVPTDIHTTDRQILQAGFSPNYLSRKFREAVGIGVHEYLVFIRLRSAAGELVSTDSSVTEIALRCGFSDSNYFKDAFKKKYGMTPRMYRKTH